MPAISAQVTVRIPPELLQEIDEAAGPRERNAWLLQAAEEKLDRETREPPPATTRKKSG